MAELPDRPFYKIGDVAELVGVKPHVLRYWESEFPGLRPLKTRGAHRMYRRRDLELACLIKRLVHEEGFTIAGAKRRLRELRAEEEGGLPARRQGVSQEALLRAELLELRGALLEMLGELDGLRTPAPAAEPASQVVLTAVVPRTALLQRRRPAGEGR